MKTLLKITSALLIIFCTSYLIAQNPGDLDSTFGINGQVAKLLYDSTSHTRALLQADGKILIGIRSPQQKRLKTVKFLPDGSLDNTWGQNGISEINFNLPGNLSNSFFHLYEQVDGKILGTGFAQSIGGDKYGLVYRLSDNGSLDMSFANTGYVIIAAPWENFITTSLAVSDNRILTFSQYLSVADAPNFIQNALHIRAYNIDGSIDSTWGNNGSMVHELLNESNANVAIFPHNPIVQPDQKVLLGFRNKVYRIMPDGQIDTDFGTNGSILPIEAKDGGANLLGGGAAHKLSFALQQDGKILISGIANGYNNVSGELGVIERYLPDGSFDESFAGKGIQTVDFRTDSLPWLWVNRVNDMDLQQDGSIIVSGTLSEDSANYMHGHFSKDNYFAMRRYTPDGEIDSVFGKNGLVITPSFHQNNANDRCYRGFVQDDDKILLIGHTLYYSLNLARYHGHAPVLEDTTVSNNNILDKNEIELFPNPVKDILNFNTSKTGSLEIYSLEGKLIESINITNAKNTINTQHLNNGVYLLRFYDNDGNQSVNKILKQ